MKKVNPKRVPCTLADVKKAKVEAVEEAVRMTSAIILTVLVDKFGMEEKIPNIWFAINRLSNSIKDGYCSVGDLIHVLRTEYGIDL